MLPQQARKAIADSPKKVANLIDLVNLPSTLREFLGQSQISRLGCFIKVWSYIKTHNLQDPNNRNVVNCDDKLKRILLGKPQVELAELPMLIKLHFPKVPKRALLLDKDPAINGENKYKKESFKARYGVAFLKTIFATHLVEPNQQWAVQRVASRIQ